jgi:hypothetical protein
VRVANPRANSQFVPSGEHPVLEWPRDAVESHDGEGLRFRETVALEDAPDFCVPWRFDAVFDEPAYPVVITLQIAGCVLRRVVLAPRLDRTPELIEVDGSSAWIGRAPYLNVGSVPELPISRLFRDALARAAMPRDRPLASEIMRHTADVAASLPIKRAPRHSHHEEAVMREAYREAVNSGISAKHEIRERVLDALCETFPDRWQRTPASAARKTPDGDSLRAHIARIERELKR